MALKNKQKAWLPILLFCITASLIATLWGYNYSSGNAEEQLPFIYRALDSNYLPNDFFTNTYAEYGPRTIFSESIAFLARLFPLAAVLFALTWICNIAIAFFSALVARYFFKDSRISPFLAAAGVLTMKTFWIGYSNIIYRNFLEPAHIAMPFILIGFYWILQKKNIPAVFAFGIAALFHALLGLETGWILFGTLLLLFLIRLLRKQTTLHEGKSLFISCLILTFFSIGLLAPYLSKGSLSSEDFINIVAYVRHPHHYLPSTFEGFQYAQAAAYLFAFILIFWSSLKRSENLRREKTYFLSIGGLIVLLCIGGYLFVEVWPSRIWTTAQMFRLPYLIKWFSIVLITGWIGDILSHPIKDESRFFGICAGISVVTPVSLAFVAGVSWIKNIILPRLKLPSWILHDGVVITLTLVSILIYKPEFRTWCLFLFLFVLILIMNQMNWRTSSTILTTALTLALSAVFILYGTILTPPQFLANEVPVLPIYKTSSETADMAKFARENTPADALFLTPPKFGAFRYMADRAIIVDLVAFPFQDDAMLEWYQRMVDCYGTSKLLGFNGLPELNQNYHALSNDQLLLLAEKYGIQYAVLYDDTNITFPVLYRTKSLKLVEVPYYSPSLLH